MPIRASHPTLPPLDVQHIHRLITGRQWFFVADPPAFVDDQAALACYTRIRHLLLPWCAAHLNGAVPWAESLLRGEPTPLATAMHGLTLQSIREFLAVYYGREDM
jgi:hypothetical protein